MPKLRKKICILASDITSNTASLTIKGIISKAYAYDYDVCVFSTLIRDSGKEDYQYGEKNIFKLPNFDQFAGVIVVAETIRIKNAEQEIEEVLKEKCKCPVVIMDKQSKYFPSVVINDEKTMERLVDHLIDEHGYTKINCLTGAMSDYHAVSRLEGYKRSLRKHNIEVEESRYMYSDCLLDSAVEYAYNIANGYLPRPEAIVCCDDDIAVMMAKEFAIQKIRVPEDIAVVGFNANLCGMNYIPCITSAVPPCKKHGENAVIMLHNMITNTRETIDRKTIGELAIGQSCGCKNDLHYAYRKRLQETQEGCFAEHYFNSNFMEENLTSAVTIDDCMVEINWYTYQLNKFKEFYICLVDDWDGYKQIQRTLKSNKALDNLGINISKDLNYVRDGYSEKMVLHTKNKNGLAKVVREEFDVKDMLPALYEERDYPTTYFFTPLHFKDRCLGYIAINFGTAIVTYDPYYPTWARNINNAIEIIRTKSELRYINERLNYMALYDGLTGVYNRFGFDQVSKEMIARCLKTKEKLLMLVGDLDDLKSINDGFGHLEGDVAISTIAKAFQSATMGNGCLGRLGGDEFVMILSGDYEESDIVEIKNRINEYLDEFNQQSTKPYEVGVSVGHFCKCIYGCKESKNDIFDDFLNNADQQMYHTKKKRKYERC